MALPSSLEQLAFVVCYRVLLLLLVQPTSSLESAASAALAASSPVKTRGKRVRQSAAASSSDNKGNTADMECDDFHSSDEGGQEADSDVAVEVAIAS